MKRIYLLVTAITIWRISAFPILIALICLRQLPLFSALLALSFLTDAIDGFLARRYHVTSRGRTEWDSPGDDLTVAAAVIGLFVFRWDFVVRVQFFIFILTILFLIHTVAAVGRYGRLTAFHTRLAKISGLAQVVFFLLCFFFSAPPYIVFYVAAILTMFDLVEEIAMILSLEEWEPDILGWFELRRRRSRNKGDHSHSPR
ncbi:MAG TPA: CDP-alcohol phosphatidyltransferase family protein [Puia sp.]|nr:CDP-alcohol phosphatidyltransferase family protein [Puia sp.]